MKINKSLKICYRVESDKGNGPFINRLTRGVLSYDEWQHLYGVLKLHTPIKLPIQYKGKWVFGIYTKKDFLDLFKPEIHEYLIRLGYFFTVYETNRHIRARDNIQCIFDKDASKCILKTKDIKELLV